MLNGEGNTFSVDTPLSAKEYTDNLFLLDKDRWSVLKGERVGHRGMVVFERSLMVLHF